MGYGASLTWNSEGTIWFSIVSNILCKEREVFSYPYIFKSFKRNQSPFPLLFWKLEACGVLFLPMVFWALRFQMRSVRSAFFLGCHQKDFNDKCSILPVWKYSWISQSSAPLCYLPFSWVPHYFLAPFSSYFTIWIFPLQYILKPSHFIYTSYTYLPCIFLYFIFLSPFSSPECCFFFYIL